MVANSTPCPLSEDGAMSSVSRPAGPVTITVARAFPRSPPRGILRPMPAPYHLRADVPAAPKPLKMADSLSGGRYRRVDAAR